MACFDEMHCPRSFWSNPYFWSKAKASSLHLQVQDTSGPAEEFFKSVADFRSAVFVTVKDNAMTLRLVGGESRLLPPGVFELQLLDGPRARLRHRHSGAPLSGSVTVEMYYAMDDPAGVTAPTITTWGVLGQPCQTSVEGSEVRDGRVTVGMDETVAWTGLQWDLVSSPSTIQDKLQKYLEDVNLRTVSVFHNIWIMHLI